MKRQLDAGAEVEFGQPILSSDSSWQARSLTVEGSVVALVSGPADNRWMTLYVLPRARGLGFADRILEWLDDRGMTLAAPPESELAEYAVVRAFRPEGAASGLQLLSPPSLRDDLRPAASICLANRRQRKVLLGRRLTDPWPYYWAFPGGGQEPGESPLEAAVRELAEETGIDVRHLTPVAVNTVYVAYRDGRRAYAINNFLMLTDALPTPTTTAEIEGRWLDYDVALGIRPMAAGTRRVLRKISAHLVG